VDGTGVVIWYSVRGAALVLLSTLLTGAPPEASSPNDAVHPLHVSTSQLAVDTTTAWLRIRMFKDDLELALAARADVESLSLAPSAEHDTLFLDYFSEAFGLRLNGTEAAGVIESSGEDLEAGDGELRIWWYLLRFDGTEPIRGIEIRNEILYKQFRDQRNIVRVLHVPTETRKTLYFAAPDGGWGKVEW
jgi:hypothetical protein